VASTEELTRFRQALETVTGNSPSNESARDALLSYVIDRPDRDAYLAVYRELTAPRQAELDLHLTGAGVQGHETNALDLADFVESISKAVKEIAKTFTGATRRVDRLLIAGVQPGSVRIRLRAPDGPPLLVNGDSSQSHGGEPDRESTPESLALREVADLLVRAGQVNDDADEDASIQLPASRKARANLQKAARVAHEARWNLEGELVQRGHTPRRMCLSTQGAAQLEEALQKSQPKSEDRVVVGTFDGHRNSGNSVFLIPDGGSSMTLTVENEQLLMRAVRVSNNTENRISATVRTHSKVADGGVQVGNVKRELVDFSELDAAGAQRGANGENGLFDLANFPTADDS